jgi:ribonuclease Z
VLDFELKILGSSSATPSVSRFPTSQILTIGNQINLIDCGEGTQMQLMRFKIKPQRICNIFISHMHGDHYFGLFGLISSMQLQGRTASLNLFGPPGLSELLSLSLRYSNTHLAFQINFRELDQSVYQQIHEEHFFTVHALPMEHRVSCCGFLFREKPKLRHLLKGAFPPNLSPSQLLKLKHGEDLYDEAGQVLLRHKDVTCDPRPSRSYAYFSDTRYNEDLLPYIRHVDLLYHEATFMDDLRHRAVQTFHSTARQAAELAAKAQVRQLLIGHFSVRYKDLTPLLEEARLYFPNTQLAVEGTTVRVSDELIKAV